MIKRNFLFAVVLWAVVLPAAHGQQFPPLPDMERILLPITVVNAPGAFGSSWLSEGSQFRDFPPDRSGLVLPGCEPPCDNPTGPTSQHTFAIDFFHTRAGDTTGSIMYVERAVSDDVSLTLRLKETSTGEEVELPVVREGQFFKRKFQILDVPNPVSGKRITLRVYGIDPDVLGRVEVRVFVEGTEPLVRDDIYDLRVVQRISSTPAGNYPVPVRPPVAEVSYYVPITDTSSLLRFEIEPLTPQMSIWGFVSITDNTTQHVTLRTPQ
jgi:hypothetical protein